MGDELTKHAKDLYDYMISFIELCGYQPSVREMAYVFKVDKRTIQSRLSLLERLGMVKLPGEKKSRCVYLPGVTFKAERTCQK